MTTGRAAGRAAGVPIDGLDASEGRGEAEGEASAEALVEVTREAGRALRRLFALGVAGGGETKAEREATEDGLEAVRDGNF